MTAKTLFNVILKIFGLLFLKDVILALPQLISSLFFFTQGNVNESLYVLVSSVLILGCYCLIIYFLLFKTNSVLAKLRLDQDIEQKELSINISTAFIITVAIVIAGGLILVDQIPVLCRQLFSYFQEKRLTKGQTTPSLSYSIVAAVKIIIALILIGERKRITSFIVTRHGKEIETT